MQEQVFFFRQCIWHPIMHKHRTRYMYAVFFHIHLRYFRITFRQKIFMHILVFRSIFLHLNVIPAVPNCFPAPYLRKNEQYQQYPDAGKAEYLTFSLRLDTRRIPPAVLKKHTRIALQEEERRIKEQGKKFVARERKKEIAEQVKLRLRSRFLPIPAEFQVVWNTQTSRIYLASTQGKVIELFQEQFTRTFDLHIEQLLPYGLALSLLGDDISARLDEVEATRFL